MNEDLIYLLAFIKWMFNFLKEPLQQPYRKMVTCWVVNLELIADLFWDPFGELFGFLSDLLEIEHIS